MLKRGRLTGSKAEIPPARLAGGPLHSRSSRQFTHEEIEIWNEANRSVLDLYGLRLAACRRIRLNDPAGPPRGALETDHRDRLMATAALAALAVTVSGRGALLNLPPESRGEAEKMVKERNDRAATCAMAEGISALSETLRGAVCEIAIGEGVRLKPGEKGGNPSLYAGQFFGDPAVAGLSRRDREARGVRTYSLAADVVEGTGASAAGEPSSGSLFYITDCEIRRVPDVYVNKCLLHGVEEVQVDTPLPQIAEAVAAARGTGEINAFTMSRPRHPIEEMLDSGVNVRTDAAGDAFPATAAGLQWGLFPDNGRPLDGVWGNVGGTAELIASASAGYYLGVRSTARFCARTIDRWEDRYRLGPGEADKIRSLGFDPERIYRIQDLVPGIDAADGLFAAAAITGNAHIPLLDAAVWEKDLAEASVLMVGASGAADLYRLTLAFRGDERSSAARLSPIIETILALPAREMKRAVREALAFPSGARRVRHEFATSFYAHFTERSGRFRLDMKSAEAVESSRAIAFLHAITEAASEWFE